MIIEFKFANFMSFRNESIFSLEPTSQRNFSENILKINTSAYRGKLLKSAFLSGGNASGKSNFLNALSILKNLIISPLHLSDAEKIKQYIPFATQTTKPTEFKLLFLIDNVKYEFYLRYNSNKILQESLSYAPKRKGKMPNLYFIDRENTKNTKFGKDETNKLKDIFDKCLSNNLFLTTASANNVKFANVVFDFFNTKLVSLDSSEILEMQEWFQNLSDYLSDEKNVEKTRQYLHKADFGIVDLVSRQDQELSVPKEIVEFTGRLIDAFPNENKDVDIKNKIISDLTLKINKLIAIKAKHSFVNETGENTTVDFNLLSNFESKGTRRFVYLSYIFDRAISDGQILLIDELETSLHPELLIFLTDLINNSTNTKAQLIFATQNYLLLDSKKSHFRNDQIWLVDKNVHTGTSDLYSLADFKGNRSNADNLNRYLKKKFGAYPNILK